VLAALGVVSGSSSACATHVEAQDEDYHHSVHQQSVDHRPDSTRGLTQDVTWLTEWPVASEIGSARMSRSAATTTRKQRLTLQFLRVQHHMTAVPSARSWQTPRSMMTAEQCVAAPENLRFADLMGTGEAYLAAGNVQRRCAEFGVFRPPARRIAQGATLPACVHFRAINSRCHLKIVSGVTMVATSARIRRPRR